MKAMNFWDWINAPDDGERFWFAKRAIVGFVVFFLIPILIYFVVKWDPVIGLNEDGEPNQLGVYIIIGLYWVSAYFVYKRHEAKSRLNCLLDKLLKEDEEEFKHLFEIAKRRREDIREDNFWREEGENRVKWFGIH